MEERGERGRQPGAGGGRCRGVEAAERGTQRALVPRTVERDLDERRPVAEVRVRARVEAPRLEVGARGGGGGGRRAARLDRRRRAAGRVAARVRGPRRVRVEDGQREALGFGQEVQAAVAAAKGRPEAEREREDDGKADDRPVERRREGAVIIEEEEADCGAVGWESRTVIDFSEGGWGGGWGAAPAIPPPPPSVLARPQTTRRTHARGR